MWAISALPANNVSKSNRICGLVPFSLRELLLWMVAPAPSQLHGCVWEISLPSSPPAPSFGARRRAGFDISACGAGGGRQHLVFVVGNRSRASPVMNPGRSRFPACRCLRMGASRFLGITTAVRLVTVGHTGAVGRAALKVGDDR